MDTLEQRREYVNRMKVFIAEHQNKISSLLQALSWTPEHIVNKCERVSCPYEGSHVVPVNSLKKHMETCQYISQGCPKEEVHLQLLEGAPISTSSLFQPQKLDDLLVNRIVRSGPDNVDNRGHRRVPASQEDYVVNFLPRERLLIYEYFQWEFKEANTRLNVEKDELLTINWEAVVRKGGLNKNKQKSRAEVMAEVRDMKRRRQTYRAKNVHITMKSYTEIMREVINNQVELLSGGNQQDELEKVDDDLPAETSHSRHGEINEAPDQERKSEQDREREWDRERRRERSERKEELARDERHRRKDDVRRRERHDRSSRKHKHRRRSRDRSPRRSEGETEVEVAHVTTSRQGDSPIKIDGGLLDDEEFIELFEDKDVVKQEVEEELDTYGISEQDLFDIKKEEDVGMETQAPPSGDESEEREGGSTGHSQSRKSKRKHKHKHKHRHRHRRESSVVVLSE